MSGGKTAPGGDEACRLETLWQGAFGDEYTERNTRAAEGRREFWTSVLRDLAAESVLEVGCNLGANLRWISEIVHPRGVFGVDVNEHALSRLRTGMPGVNAVWALARDLPFRDRFFDLVFTTGVLIHQPPETLDRVMSEIVRCSKRYVLAGEYFAETTVEVPYRGEKGALFKRDYGRVYRELFPELRLIREGFLARGTGWDDVTFWIFERA